MTANSTFRRVHPVKWDRTPEPSLPTRRTLAYNAWLENILIFWGRRRNPIVLHVVLGRIQVVRAQQQSPSVNFVGLEHIPTNLVPPRTKLVSNAERASFQKPPATCTKGVANRVNRAKLPQSLVRPLSRPVWNARVDLSFMQANLHVQNVK